MQTVLAIATGGALGSVLRHFLNNAATGLIRSDFPWGILIINVLGSFAMGVLTAVFAHSWAAPQHVKAFLTVGILGGFTTFSTSPRDRMLLIQRGASGAAAFYSIGSVVIGVGGLFAGMKLA